MAALAPGLPRRGPPTPRDPQRGDDGSHWVEEVTHDGQRSWYNVLTAEVRWSCPPNLRESLWRAEGGSGQECVFVHKLTHERIPRRETKAHARGGRGQSAARRPRRALDGPEAVVEPAHTALGKKIIEPTAADLARRLQQMSSTRSVMDRQIFARDFHVVVLADGSGEVRRRKGRQETLCRLTAAELAIYRANPHLQQVFANGRPFVRADHLFGADDRVAQRDGAGLLAPRSPYARRQGEVKTVEHWGQRKLILSEIEFLTLYGHLAPTVVYAGSAPGTHINFLSRELFPHHRFVLIDPAPFDARETAHISIRQAFFTDAIAAEFAGQDVLFICDIRSMEESQPEHEKEHRVHVDMQWQQKWVQIMQPKASMLKFRLPYPPPDGSTEYLEGIIFLPVWGGRTTTETRLIVTDPSSKRIYNHKEYEDFMFHFNTVTRTAFFDHTVRAPGLDHCYDCMSEIFLLRAWLRKFRPEEDESKLDDAVVALSNRLSKQISSSGRTLVLSVHSLDH